MPLLTKEQGSALAHALLYELKPSVRTASGVKSKQVKELLDLPPPRSDLAFYERDGQDAPKVVLDDSDILFHLFCISHCDYVLKPGTDIDHGTPFAAMRAR